MSKFFIGLIGLFCQTMSIQHSYGNMDTDGTQCSRLHQSPINIPMDSLPECSLNADNTNEIYLDLNLRDTSLTRYIIKNDGYSIYALPFKSGTDNPKEIHEIQMLHESDESVFSFNNPLSITYESDTNTRYCFDSLHFHWGSNDSVGSEHTFNGKQTPLEAHFVSYSCDYKDIREALNAYSTSTAKDKYVLGVVGVLFELGEANKALDKMLDPALIDRVKEYGKYTPGVIEYNYANFNITDLIPGYSLDNPDKSLASVAMYLGSLTTPPCLESIRWFVMKNKLTVSAEQLEQFRRILNKKGVSSSDNYREVLPLNNRTIYNCEYQIINDKFTSNDGSNNNSGLNNKEIMAIIGGSVLFVILLIIFGYLICKPKSKSKKIKKDKYSGVQKNEGDSGTLKSPGSIDEMRASKSKDGIITVVVKDVPVSSPR